MGQQTSFLEFSQEISKLHDVKCNMSTVNSDPMWRTLFLSPMTDDEICSFFSFDDIRKLRRYHPDRLALVLMKCIEQLVDFVENAQEVLDYCSVMNAVRMLGNAFPYLYEDMNVKATEIKQSTIVSKRTLDRQGSGVTPISPFAENFSQHFFWENKTCEGISIETCPTIANAWSQNPKLTVAPLGETVVRCLVRLNFIPRFTIAQTELPSVEEQELVDDKSFRIFDSLVWYGSKTATAASSAFRQMEPRRVVVLRALLQCLSWSVFQAPTSSPPVNLFVATLLDNRKCSMSPTLCRSLLNRITSHESRGSLPYSSYLAAETPEKILEFSVGLLSVALDQPNPAVNCFHRVIRDSIDSKPEESELLVVALHRIIDNPLFSSKTFFKESQRLVKCSMESLVLLYNLLDFGHIRSFAVKHMRYMLFSLLYYVQECGRTDTAFYEMQTATFIILRLSANETFLREVLNEKLPAQPPLFILPDLMDTGNATYGDALLLMMCFVVSPASPRWFLPMFPAVATIFSNAMSTVNALTETTCFEIHHALEFLLHRNVLKKGVEAQRACQLWVEGIVVMASRSPKGCVPLTASLGVGTAIASLKQLIGGDLLTTAELENIVVLEGAGDANKNNAGASREPIQGEAAAAPPADESHSHKLKPFKLIDRFVEDMPAEVLLQICEDAKQKLDLLPSVTLTEPESRSSAYDVLVKAQDGTAGLVMPPQLSPTIRNTVITPEMRQWALGMCWRALHKHNTRPPLFDFRTAKLI